MLRRVRPPPRSRWRRLRDDWERAPRQVKALVVGSAVLGGVVLASHVETMEQTGRRRFMLLSPNHEEQLGQSAYEQILSRSRVLPPSHPMSRAVQRVGRKIVEESDAPYMQWQFHVIEASEPNAFCLPGGKVFVHTGLFKVLSNEDTLAAVLFHEAAHGIARHGAEKISLSLLVYGLLALFFPDFGHLSDLVVKLAVDLPFSRKLELEADAIGLRLMAKACYDPRASLKMNAALGQLEQLNPAAQFKYFSTHPPSAERIQALRAQLQEARDVYEASGCDEAKKRWDVLCYEAVAYALTHLDKTESSGRRRFMLLSPEYERRLGERALARILDNYRAVSPTHPSCLVVERIGQHIGQSLRGQHLQWEFQVIESWECDAVCLPGGKVVVHSGLLDALGGDEDALAAVLCHESAHGYLRHGSEKVSLSLLAMGTLLFFVLEFGVFFFFYPGPGPVDDLMTRLAVSLPFTRKQETEADDVALRLMARGCFDPRASADLHKLLNRLPGGRFGFLTKHGVNAERMYRLREPLREAVDVFESSDCNNQQAAFATIMSQHPDPEW